MRGVIVISSNSLNTPRQLYMVAYAEDGITTVYGVFKSEKKAMRVAKEYIPRKSLDELGYQGLLIGSVQPIDIECVCPIYFGGIK